MLVMRFMNRKPKKGFTLIELLAVIVILAIIALIASPIIIGLIDDARKEAFKDSAYGIVKAGEVFYSKKLIGGTNEKVTFTYTGGEETSTPGGEKLDYNGSKPNSGEVKINKNGEVALAIHNGKYCAEKGYEETEITLSEKAVGECNIIVWAYTDSDSSGTVNVGDEITVETESFYIMSNDGINIKALAKYNLYVGGIYNSGWTAYGSEATGLQNSTMLGYVSGQTVSYGTTPFSSSTVKGTNYSDYVGSIVEGYVNAYKTKLEELGATINSATLIKQEELIALGCSGYTCSSAPGFVYSTSYWSSSVNDTCPDALFGIRSNGDYDDPSCNTAFYSNDTHFGVRPVITISLSEI